MSLRERVWARLARVGWKMLNICYVDRSFILMVNFHWILSANGRKESGKMFAVSVRNP